MVLIQLNEQQVMSRQDDSVYGGWMDHTVFEPFYLNADQIESMSEKGITIIRTKSGEIHKVKESVDDIMSLISKG